VFPLDDADSCRILADGLFAREAGLNWARPCCRFLLPPAEQAGVVRVDAYLPPSFAALLPLTVTARAPGHDARSFTIRGPGRVRLEIACGAPPWGPAADAVVLSADKSLVPRDAGLGPDERPLALAVLAIEFLEGSGPAGRGP
jgi:hypothetical protein